MSHDPYRVSPLLGLARVGFGPTARSFRRATLTPDRAQARLLEELAQGCARTQYGVSHGVRSAEDFRARLPIVTYDALSPWLEEQRRSESNALVSDPVIFYEKTSGSTAAAKHIPYTAALRRSFARMFAIWAHDLLANGPGLCRGTMYFSVSPRLAPKERTERGLKVGLDDDSDYLGPVLKHALKSFVVDDSEARLTRDAEIWKTSVARALVARPDLEVISIWNPSMLSILLDHIEQHRTDLARMLGRSPRARALSNTQVDWPALWPALKLISCWASAAAGPLSRALNARLPHVMLQGKGLLATEAPLTVPLLAAGSFVPLLDEVFFELEDVRTKQIRLLHEVTLGPTYELIISQRGGLSRYRLGDRVRMTHAYGATPCLEFVGRGADTSDLVGEKLHEDFVSDALNQVLGQQAGFYSLVPRRTPSDHYVLLLDREPTDRTRLSAEVDRALSRAHHYAHARSLGQLGPVEVSVATNAAERVRDVYLRRGVKWGDLKHHALLTTLADETLCEVSR